MRQLQAPEVSLGVGGQDPGRTKTRWDQGQEAGAHRAPQGREGGGPGGVTGPGCFAEMLGPPAPGPPPWPCSPQEHLSGAPHEQSPQSGLLCAHEGVLGFPLLGCPARARVRGPQPAAGSGRPLGEGREQQAVRSVGCPPPRAWRQRAVRSSPSPLHTGVKGGEAVGCPPTPPAQEGACSRDAE